MKVSILTYHWEDNYGATMQAYATYRAVQDLGHTPEFIDLRLPYNPPLTSRVVFALKRFRFNCFRKKYFTNLSPKTYWSLEELRKNPPVADCYLVGSDQTWNPQIAKGLLPAFFLTFGPETTRRVTYATSIGLNEWEESPFITNKEISESLCRFQKILLREDSAIKIAYDIFKANAEQVIDPVLLFSSYNELTGPLTPSGELITYKLIDDSGFYCMAREVARSLDLKARSIGSVRQPKGIKASYPETVDGWIKRIASASFVLTDSFHGTVLSILYHRPFIIKVGDTRRITRIVSLLSILGLSDRILTGDFTPEEVREALLIPIDWNSIDKKLDSLRTDSLSKLKNALS